MKNEKAWTDEYDMSSLSSSRCANRSLMGMVLMRPYSDWIKMTNSVFSASEMPSKGKNLSSFFPLQQKPHNNEEWESARGRCVCLSSSYREWNCSDHCSNNTGPVWKWFKWKSMFKTAPSRQLSNWESWSLPWGSSANPYSQKERKNVTRGKEQKSFF